VLLAASSRRKRIWPAKVTVTGHAGQPCAPIDRANALRTLTEKRLWISYPSMLVNLLILALGAWGLHYTWTRRK